ncbi:MAG: DNA polymerase III subunit beta [Patescibacteria group bacterium]
MKVSLLFENLSKKISFVNHAVSARSQLPILLNFLIEAKKGKLSISATDLEIGISADIPAKIEEEGRITVPAKTLTELITATPLKKIVLETRPEGLSLTGEKVKTVFQTTAADEFPMLYEEKGKETMNFEKENIERDLSRVVFAASQDTERPALSGVLIKEEKDGFLLVATDGYRLSLKKNALGKKEKSEEGESIAVIVPARAIRELILMGKEEGGESISVYSSAEKNQIIFSKDDITLVGRLIEAEFPSYEKIIPEDHSVKTVFRREELQKAVKASYVFARQKANIVKLAIKKEAIIVSADAPSVGESTIEVDAKTTGEENEIAFNARYLLDFFSNITEDEVSFEMTGPLNPGVFKAAGDDSFLHLIMPIRVQSEA